MKELSNKNSCGNYDRVDNIETLMELEGYTYSKDFAHDIDMLPQNFSRAMQSGNVTEKMCQKIIKAFPEYRIEWLLGYDNLKTHEEWADNIQEQKNNVAYAMWGIIEKSLNKQGKTLKFVHRTGEHVDATERLHADCYYSIEDRDGNQLKKLSALEMAQLENQIQEYCDFLIWKSL